MMGCDCWEGICSSCHGIKKLVIGVLLLINAFVWPKWLGVDGWIAFAAVLMVILGVMKFAMPSCGHCGGSMPMMEGGKKKRK